MFHTHADCRVCGHWHYWNAETLVKFECWENESRRNRCYCSKETFRPADNLEYLKWCYEQKEKV
jgi:hypothetical protein